MDNFYDVNAAAIDLDENITDMATQPGQLIQVDTNNLHISAFQNPRTWRIAEFSTETSMMEEVTFRVQGILCAKFLPPISKPLNANTMIKQRPFLRQQANITGLGSPLFEQYIEKTIQIHIAFANNFPDDALEHWQYGNYAGSKSLEAQTRYFDRRGASTDPTDTISFDHFVDPEGVLQSMIGDGFYHGTDNHVDYKSRIITTEGSVKYSAISPAFFKIGDIVEIAISFVVYPIKDNRYKMIPMLRGLLLINQKERDKAAILRMKARSIPTNLQIAQVKRRRDVYTDEDAVEETDRRLGRMKIGQ